MEGVISPKISPQAWSPKLDAELIALYESHMDFEVIAKKICRSTSSIYSRLWRLRKKCGGLRPRPGMWTVQETERAKQFSREGLTYKQIAKKLGRTDRSVRYKLREGREKILRIVTDPKIEIPAHVERDLDRRCATHYSNLTAAVFGDPLPGFSALDRRRATLSQKEAA